MKKEKLPLYLSALLLVLLAFCLFRIGRLEVRLQNLENSLNSHFSGLYQSVDSLESRLIDAQREGENPLSESGWEYGEYDAETGLVAVLVHLNLKECDPTTTQVTLNCNGTPRLMRWDGARFVARLELPLAEYSQVTTVLMEDNGVLRTQALNWSICPLDEITLQVEAHFDCAGKVEKKDGKLLDRRHGTVLISAFAKGDGRSVRSIDLVWMADDEELSRRAVDMGYAAQARATEGTGYAINADPTVYESGRAGQYFAAVQDDRAVSQDAALALYAVVTDDLGLQYWALCDMTCVGDRAGTATSVGGSVSRILDPNGNELHVD